MVCERAASFFIFCGAIGYLLRELGYLAAPWFIEMLVEKDAPR